jgi:hypothetical protein
MDRRIDRGYSVATSVDTGGAAESPMRGKGAPGLHDVALEPMSAVQQAQIFSVQDEYIQTTPLKGIDGYQDMVSPFRDVPVLR